MTNKGVFFLPQGITFTTKGTKGFHKGTPSCFFLVPWCCTSCYLVVFCLPRRASRGFTKEHQAVFFFSALVLYFVLLGGFLFTTKGTKARLKSATIFAIHQLTLGNSGTSNFRHFLNTPPSSLSANLPTGND